MDLKKYIKIYDRNHYPLDELSDANFSPPQYGWTLGDIDTATFSLSLSDKKCNPANVLHLNHVEIVDSNNVIQWGGLITDRNFDDPDLKITCSDYNLLLKLRRLRAKQYPTLDYGVLMRTMIQDSQAARPDYPIGTTNYNLGSGALQTTRLVENKDNLWTKIKDFGDDLNYDYWVDTSRVFNFSTRRGSDKPKYTLEYGGDADNITQKPTLTDGIRDCINSIYAESQLEDNSILSSTAEDAISQALYGLIEGTFSPNSGVSDQSTLDTQTAGALQREAYPIQSFTVTAQDSTLCPFSDLFVGDAVTVHLIPYFDFRALMRIIRMVHDEKDGSRSITFGSIVYKPQPPIKRLYKKWS